MTSKGFVPGCDEANEAWPGGCQSCVSTTLSKRAASRLIIGTTSSPLGTASAPPGMKSFWTSTTMRQASAATACGIPVSFQVGDQRRAEMAVGLLAGVHRHVAAKQIERLLAGA